MASRLGHILVEQGVLSKDQVLEVLSEQGARRRPFGEIAERLFGIDPLEVERAWARQYAERADRVDLAGITPGAEVLGSIERRQAWQFRVVPLRVEDGALVIATSAENLPRALRFANRCLAREAYLVIADDGGLSGALQRLYPMAQLDAGGLTDARAMLASMGTMA